jgi:hypothetical protein
VRGGRGRLRGHDGDKEIKYEGHRQRGQARGHRQRAQATGTGNGHRQRAQATGTDKGQRQRAQAKGTGTGHRHRPWAQERERGDLAIMMNDRRCVDHSEPERHGRGGWNHREKEEGGTGSGSRIGEGSGVQ